MSIDRRMINQPSKKQPLHKLHGTRVLADWSTTNFISVQVYFVEGDVVSARVPIDALSRDAEWWERGRRG